MMPQVFGERTQGWFGRRLVVVGSTVQLIRKLACRCAQTCAATQQGAARRRWRTRSHPLLMSTGGRRQHLGPTTQTVVGSCPHSRWRPPGHCSPSSMVSGPHVRSKTSLVLCNSGHRSCSQHPLRYSASTASFCFVHVLLAKERGSGLDLFCLPAQSAAVLDGARATGPRAAA